MYNNRNGKHPNYMIQQIGNAENLAKIIKPNINNSYKSAKRIRTLFIALIFVCVIVLISGINFSTVSDGFKALMFIGYIGIPICGLFTGVFIAKTIKFKNIISLISEIEAYDKVSLDDLTLSKYIGKNSVILIINKLIQTDNLRGYEVIGNVGVARTELRAKERDFVSVAVTDALKVATENVEKRYRCPGCGAAITEKTGKFCTFCGVRLE